MRTACFQFLLYIQNGIRILWILNDEKTFAWNQFSPKVDRDLIVPLYKNAKACGKRDCGRDGAVFRMGALRVAAPSRNRQKKSDGD